MIEILPSILAADFARLGEQIAQVERGGASMLHLDVMDGHFVPNLTIGPPVVASIRKVTRLKLDVHLMIEDPDKYAPIFIDAGADQVIVHQEACKHLDGTLRSANCRGQEKLRQLTLLRSQYPGARIVAYGNSVADIAHMQHTDEATLVNAGRGARQMALALGLKVADWR